MAVDVLSHGMLILLFCRMLAQNLIDIALYTVQVQAKPFSAADDKVCLTSYRKAKIALVLRRPQTLNVLSSVCVLEVSNNLAATCTRDQLSIVC